MAAWKGSVKGDGAEQQHFPVAAQGHTVRRERLRIHVCAHCFFFYSILFWASFSSLLSLVPPRHLSFNYSSRRRGCVREKESGNARWWLAATKQTAAAAGRPSSRRIAHGLAALPVGRMGACWHLSGSQSHWGWAAGGAGVNPLPSTGPVAAVCCRGAAPRSWRQWHFKHCRCLLSGCESVFNFQALCYLGGSSLISPFCPSCRWRVNRELYVPHVRCH